MGPDGPKWGQEDFFPTNPDLADILGRTDFDFQNFYFLDFLGSQFGPSLGPAWARAWARAWLGPSLGPGLGPAWARAWAQAWARAWAQTPPAPPAPVPAPPDEFSDPNLTPLPTHPGIKYVARTLAATNHARCTIQ